MLNKNLLITDIWKVFTKGNFLVMFFFLVCGTVMYINFHVYFKDLFCILVLFFCGTIRYRDKIARWLIMFSISYAIIVLIKTALGVYDASYSELASYLLGPLAFYVFGKFIVDQLKLDGYLDTFFLLTIIFLGSKVYYDLFIDLANGSWISTERIFHSNEDFYLAATITGTSVSLGLVGLSAFISQKRPFTSLKAMFFFVLSGMSLLTVIHLVNRTGLFVFLICTIVTILYLSGKTNITRFLLIILIVTVVSYVVMDISINEEVLGAYENRNSVSTIDSGGGRTYRWIDSLGQILKHPFGWKSEYSFVHNFWLDVARVAGIIPFICIMIATIKSSKIAFRLFRIKGNSFVAILTALNACFFFSCFVEPVLEGISTYVYLYCMLWGIQKRYEERINSSNSKYIRPFQKNNNV